MNTAISNASAMKSKLLTWALAFSLCLLIVASLQVMIVSACLHFANKQDATFEQPENTWLQVAELLSVSNPDVFYARSKYLRQKSLLFEFQAERKEILSEALSNLAAASKLRPLWPYYSLSELNILTLLDSDPVLVQSKVSHIIELAPNERGLDKHFLEVALYNWSKLSKEQQQWMLARMMIIPRGTLSYLYASAKNINRSYVICTQLPFNKIKRLCRS
jgi:hypothetical protein